MPPRPKRKIHADEVALAYYLARLGYAKAGACTRSATRRAVGMEAVGAVGDRGQVWDGLN